MCGCPLYAIKNDDELISCEAALQLYFWNIYCFENQINFA